MQSALCGTFVKEGEGRSLRWRGLAITTWADRDQAEWHSLPWCAGGVLQQGRGRLCRVPAESMSLTGGSREGTDSPERGTKRKVLGLDSRKSQH